MFARRLIFVCQIVNRVYLKEGSLRGREILYGCTSGSRLYMTTTFFICFDQTFSLRAKTQLVQKCTSALELDVCKLLFKKSKTRILMYFALVIHRCFGQCLSIRRATFLELSIDRLMSSSVELLCIERMEKSTFSTASEL